MYAIALTQNVFSGRWRCFIIWYLEGERRRFTEIKNFLGGLSQSSLTIHLKELVNDGIIKREAYPEVPPRVGVFVKGQGIKLLPILENMEDFVKEYGKKPGSDEG